MLFRSVEALGELRVIGNDDDLGVSRLDLLRHRTHLHSVFVVEHEADDRGRTELAFGALDQRERTVLERAARVALSVDVGALLDLEGPPYAMGSP